jgi:hypothetical protein
MNFLGKQREDTNLYLNIKSKITIVKKSHLRIGVTKQANIRTKERYLIIN